MVHHDSDQHHHDDHEYGHQGYFTDGRSFVGIVVSSTYLSILVLMAIVGNLLVIIAIGKFKYLREDRFHLFLINLAITDLLTGLVIMISSVITISNDYRSLNTIWCNITGALNYVLITVSLLTIACISVVRFIAVSYPIHYRNNLKSRYLIILILITWLIGLIFAIPPIVMEWISYDYWEGICAIDWHAEYNLATYYIIFASALCFFVPALLIVISYTCIVMKTKQRKPSRNGSSIVDERRNDHSKKIFQLILLLVISFFVFMTPYFITKLLKVIYDVGHIPKEINLFASFMQYLASALNPLIYAVIRQDFRNAFKTLIGKVLRYDKEDTTSNSRSFKVQSRSASEFTEIADNNQHSSATTHM